jgi:hypothetical protein
MRIRRFVRGGILSASAQPVLPVINQLKEWTSTSSHASARLLGDSKIFLGICVFLEVA